MKFRSKSKEFAGLYLKLHKVTKQVAEPALKIEVRRMTNGVEFFVNHLHQTILVRFPGMTDWLDFLAIELDAVAVMQGQILTTLPKSELDEVVKLLKVKNGGAK